MFKREEVKESNKVSNHFIYQGFPAYRYLFLTSARGRVKATTDVGAV